MRQPSSQLQYTSHSRSVRLCGAVFVAGRGSVTGWALRSPAWRVESLGTHDWRVPWVQSHEAELRAHRSLKRSKCFGRVERVLLFPRFTTTRLAGSHGSWMP